MALFLYTCFNLAIAFYLFGSIIHTSAAGENFVRPSEDQTCPFDPCLPIDNYTREADQYFIDNTIFIFLPGTHQLNLSLNLNDKSNITLLVRDDDKLNGVSLIFNTSVHITWKNCFDIQISDLHIVLSARGIAGDENFTALVFHGTNGSLSRLTFHGNEASSTGAIFVDDLSEIKISNMTVFGANRIQGAALYADNSIVEIYGQNTFIDNRADNEGGAVAFNNCTCNINGSISFINNTAWEGGAMALIGGNCNIHGDISFISNVATIEGGALFLNGGWYNITGRISFMENSADHGGAISVYDTETDIILDNVDFISNSAVHSGGAMYLGYGDHTVAGNISFVNNSAGSRGGAITMLSGNYNINGNISFENNMCDNYGGAMAFTATKSSHISGIISFIHNVATVHGGAIYMEDGFVSISGTQQYIGNFAEQGGTMAISGTSKLILTEPLTVEFIENQAASYGGVIFVDSNYNDQCTGNDVANLWPECFFELSDYNAEDIHLNFINNTASQAGRILYGGNIDRCKLYKDGGSFDDCGNRQGGDYDNNPVPKFESISSVVSVDDNVSDISSDPLQVCFCSQKSSTEIQCTDQEKQTVRGRELVLHAVIVGQTQGVVPSAVRVQLNNNVKINETQHMQNTTNECTEIRYRPFSRKNTITLVLYPDNSPCRDSGISRREIEITFDSCPDGFDLQGDECFCDERLIKKQYTNNCSVNDNSIFRSSNTFWIGVDYYSNSTYKGLILHDPGCPFDYCFDTPISITLDNLDVQCNHNHAGLLCGSCKDNCSITFGTVHCLPCSHAYLALILPFALAGIALVAVLLLLKLSVANGTINGLIFYVNIIQANRSTFFPLGKTNPLTIFVAWLNLDLGIETCFYDGMDTYVFTWLQFVFPFYIWFLIGLIIVVTHYSSKATRMLGDNPVAALATLLLLSYSKLLRTVIMALSVTTLEYPGDAYKKVWLYDGNVPYFGHTEHIILGLFSILVLVLLFLPYTLLLFCGHWLQAYSQWKVLSWINKLKPVFDAYHAPYKKETRYWTGLLLVVRCILLLVFGLNAFGKANVNLLAITTFTACLLALASLHRGVYTTFYNNIFETFFILNLCIFSAATYHVKEINGNQAGLAYTSVGTVFFTFLLIVSCHVYLVLSKTSVCHKKLPSLNFVARLVGAEVEPDQQGAECNYYNAPNGGQDEQYNLATQTPTITTSVVDIHGSENKPLLSSK